MSVNMAERDPIDVVKLELTLEFAGRLSDDTIESLAVAEVASFDGAKVRDYVVLLAGRRARAHAKALVALHPGE
jgi:hypothetical protein